jgi:hypothetical protein
MRAQRVLVLAEVIKRAVKPVVVDRAEQIIQCGGEQCGGIGPAHRFTACWQKLVKKLIQPDATATVRDTTRLNHDCVPIATPANRPAPRSALHRPKTCVSLINPRRKKPPLGSKFSTFRSICGTRVTQESVSKCDPTPPAIERHPPNPKINRRKATTENRNVYNKGVKSPFCARRSCPVQPRE